MKTIFACLQVLVLLAGSGPAFADDSPTDTLRKTLHRLQDTYPPYLENTFRSQVFNYFSWRFQDILAVTQGLSAQADQAWAKSTAASQGWDDLFGASATASNSRMETSAVELSATLATMQRQSRLLEQLANDSVALARLWPARCGAPRLGFATELFKPTVLYSPSLLDLKAPGSIITIGFQVSTDYSGGIGNPGFFSGSDAVVVTTATAIGACFGPLGGAIGAVAGSLVVTVKNLFTWFGEHGEQESLIKQIVKVQTDKISDLDGHAEATIQQVCTQALPETTGPGDPAITTLLEHNAEVIRQKATQAATKALEAARQFKQLEERFRIRISTVVKAQAALVRANYLKDLQALDEQIESSDRSIEGELPQLLNTIAKRRQAVSPFEIADANQDLWDELLDGEALFAPTESYSFATLWNVRQEFIRGEISK